MNRLIGLSLAAIFVPLAVAGCGGPAGQHPVIGKVLVHGQPAPGATVYFQREGGPATPGAPVPVGVADRAGEFRVETPAGRGAPAGKYAVLVEWRDPAAAAEAPPPRKPAKARKNRIDRVAPDRLAGRYFNPGAPRLHAEVKETTNYLPPFEIP